MDSCPGGQRYGAVAAAFSADLAPLAPPLRLLALLAVHVAVVAAFVWRCAVEACYRAAGEAPPPSALHRLRADLNDPGLFPVSAPRVYVFSDADVMVDEAAVVEHAGEAGRVGFVDVRRERFVGTAHVGHVVGDSNAKRYWRIVEGIVEDGIGH